jgi:hypothetical protein
MYKKDETFVQPEDEEIKVWRYMDFAKLISLIDSRRLFFARADKLGDPFEGSYPTINIQRRSQLPESVTKSLTEDGVRILIEAIKVGFDPIRKSCPRFTAINCWHMSNYESAAMWSLYLKSNEGVAIQTTYSKLKKSFTGDESILLGVVKYIDYESESWSSQNVLSPFVHKRKSFEHEKEVRALYVKWPIPIEGKGINFNQDTIDHGVEIKIDLEVLIEKIYVAPNAPIWFSELVRSIISHYGYSFEVIYSKLNDGPLF